MNNTYTTSDDDNQGEENTPGDENMKEDNQGGENTSDEESMQDDNLEEETSTGNENIHDDYQGEESTSGDESIQDDNQGEENTPGDENLQEDNQGGENIPGDENIQDDNQGEENTPGDENIQDDNQGEENTPSDETIQDVIQDGENTPRDENIQSQKRRISFFTKDTFDDESSDDNIPLSRLKVVEKNINEEKSDESESIVDSEDSYKPNKADFNSSDSNLSSALSTGENTSTDTEDSSWKIPIRRKIRTKNWKKELPKLGGKKNKSLKKTHQHKKERNLQ